MSRFLRFFFCTVLPVSLLASGCTSSSTSTPTPAPIVWWKGNTHTHTLWSDGNAAPEHVAHWYSERGYHFLVLSDHNTLSDTTFWFPVSETGRLTPHRVDSLRHAFGDDEVVVRERDGQTEMRLKTLVELRERFERPGQFLFIQGQELSDEFEERPIHINGLNLAEVIPPQGGSSVREVLQRNVDAIIEQGRRLQRPVLAHINHPNFHWALTPEDVATVRGEQFFEVYNGHSAVRNEGDATHPSMEELWDIALTLRLTELDLGLLYGLATDDSHEYFEIGLGHTNPGRGWVMVRADTLTPAAILNALHAGDFYASSGVSLNDVQVDAAQYMVEIAAEPGVTYTTQFIGTRRTPNGPGPVGEELSETTANPAVYSFSGDELYVRAKVTSSRLHPNPYAEGDFETAWTQPVQP